MNPARPEPPEAAAAAADSAAFEDPRLLAAVQEYLAALETGRRPNRQEFLKRHPDVAAELAVCLDGLAFVRSAVAGLAEAPTAAEAAEIDRLLQSPLGDYRILRELGRGGMGGSSTRRCSCRWAGAWP
jgi:hypothetical protein